MGSLGTDAPIRLAILEADTPMKGIHAKYGGYGGVFTYMFERACASLDPPLPLKAQLDLSSHDVVNDLGSYPDPDTLDAILITGSKHDSFESDEWIVRLTQYTKRCLETGRVRVIGVCFGHQIIARAMGAEVGRNPRGWEVSAVRIDLTPEGKQVFGKDSLAIYQMHRDAVLTFPTGVISLAETDICPNQAMYIPRRMMSVQGHPEFTVDMMTEIIETRKYGGILNKDISEDGLNRVGDPQDGVAIAQVFIRFLRE
ncbi:putative class I glutamine amidotransferase [Xylariaceae sp. FL1019]|nr:putative class I glutamine amidotransferase [Xylariaceae sp. FL1019]